MKYKFPPECASITLFFGFRSNWISSFQESRTRRNCAAYYGSELKRTYRGFGKRDDEPEIESKMKRKYAIDVVRNRFLDQIKKTRT